MPWTSERAKRVKRYRKRFKQHIKLLLLREMASDPDDSDEEMVDGADGKAYDDNALRRFSFRNASYKNTYTHNILEDYCNMGDNDFLLHTGSFVDIGDFTETKGNWGFVSPPSTSQVSITCFPIYVLYAAGSDANHEKIASRFKTSNRIVKILLIGAQRQYYIYLNMKLWSGQMPSPERILQFEYKKSMDFQIVSALWMGQYFLWNLSQHSLAKNIITGKVAMHPCMITMCGYNQSNAQDTTIYFSFTISVGWFCFYCKCTLCFCF